jgi:hypothetical protein
MVFAPRTVSMADSMAEAVAEPAMLAVVRVSLRPTVNTRVCEPTGTV